MYKSVLGKNWQPRDIDEREVYKYINNFGLSDLLSRILISRDITEEQVLDYLDPKIKNLLPDPFHLIDMKSACERVAEAVSNHEKITVFGDYDVDGATSSALLMRLFNMLGANAKVYIPDRISEGYGPSSASMEKFRSEGSNIVITVDCGISGFDAASKAKEIGLDLIILDHHISDVILPEAYAIVNPNRFDENTKLKHLAAVGVAFLFSIGLLNILRGKNYFKNMEEPKLLDLLDLVALGTVCDMMPLTGLNRAFIVQGLKVMSKKQNIGLKILADYGKVDSIINTYHLGFIIGPRINAGGRVGKSYLGTHLLTTNDQDIANKYAAELEQYNEERKVIEQEVLEEAILLAEKQSKQNYIIISSDTWHQGVIGIVAGKLKERFQKPVAAISIEGEIGKASCRSVRGIDFGSKIVEAKKRNILLTGGGHAMAAGFTIHKDRIGELIEFLQQSQESDEQTLRENNNRFYDAELSPAGATIEIAKEILKLEPYGNGNSEPIVKIDGLYVLKANVSNNKHVSCMLAPDKNSFGSSAIKAIAFNCIGTLIGDTLLSDTPYNLSMIGSIKINSWNGKSNVQLVINDIIIN